MPSSASAPGASCESNRRGLRAKANDAPTHDRDGFPQVGLRRFSGRCGASHASIVAPSQRTLVLDGVPGRVRRHGMPRAGAATPAILSRGGWISAQVHSRRYSCAGPLLCYKLLDLGLVARKKYEKRPFPDKIYIKIRLYKDKIVGFHDATRLATLQNSAMPGRLTPRHTKGTVCGEDDIIGLLISLLSLICLISYPFDKIR